jgi:hypothetical protein
MGSSSSAHQLPMPDAVAAATPPLGASESGGSLVLTGTRRANTHKSAPRPRSPATVTAVVARSAALSGFGITTPARDAQAKPARERSTSVDRALERNRPMFRSPRLLVRVADDHVDAHAPQEDVEVAAHDGEARLVRALVIGIACVCKQHRAPHSSSCERLAAEAPADMISCPARRETGFRLDDEL